MNRKLRSLPFLFALLAFGCQPAAPEIKTGTPEKGKGSESTPQASTGGETAAKPSLDIIPAELKHEAFAYYGLANSKPMDMEIVDSNNPGTPRTGSQTITFKEMRDGKAIFDLERTGNLTILGSQEVSLEKDGVWVTKSSLADIKHEMEIPSELTTGKTWNSELKLESANVDLKNSFKIVGPERVKTKVADRDAILITSTSTGTMQGKKVRIESKTWYVRDVGGVKSVVKIVSADGKTQTMTIQETK